MFKHLSWYDVFIYTMKYQANDCENTSFIQSETLLIVLHRVNLNINEIKSIVFILQLLFIVILL